MIDMNGELEDLIQLIPTPPFVVWDITYACPLRCEHCYSESGRRPSKQLPKRDMERVVAAIIEATPRAVVLAGGEPLLVRNLFDITRSLRDAGIDVVLYTSGWTVTPLLLPDLMTIRGRIVVSVDGATAEVHDRIRGRPGSFARAVQALRLIDEAIAAARADGKSAPELAIDVVVTRSNFEQMLAVATDVAGCVSTLSALSFGAVIPIGLASRDGYIRHEVLDEDQSTALADGSFIAALRLKLPSNVEISTGDNRHFQMHPDLLAAGADIPPIQIEPDGRARAMPIYEGTVGSLLHEPLRTLWARAIRRWHDPFVVDVLRPAVTMRAWGKAAQRIDLRFGAPDDRDRIARRPVYVSE